ncbi:hypothetical protein [Herbaspirillum sp. RV1423]|uniref:hypothetical protein n=1 Tax=Herbaspirillum sp. RV1423 TaxID=1443993 RepID=UPI00054D5B2F|nr:hypothetical protein [Herbaspirillum sp. RV1423]
MNTGLLASLSDSANDFKNVVWPRISTTPLVGGGVLKPVEAVAEKEFKDELDLLAGIDAWQILYDTSSIRGIASRVQWGSRHDSFSIRIAVRSGNDTEFQKRLYAIRNRQEGPLYPHITIQAYLDRKNGSLQAAAAIKTIDLIEAAAFLMEKRESLYSRPDFYGFIANGDGSSFIYMRWSYLIYKGLLQEADIVASL